MNSQESPRRARCGASSAIALFLKSHARRLSGNGIGEAFGHEMANELILRAGGGHRFVLQQLQRALQVVVLVEKRLRIAGQLADIDSAAAKLQLDLAPPPSAPLALLDEIRGEPRNDVW